MRFDEDSAVEVDAIRYLRCIWCTERYGDTSDDAHVEVCSSCGALICPACGGCSPRCSETLEKLTMPDPSRVKRAPRRKTVRPWISIRLRFQIFERDHFTCQYCGRKAPDVVLTVDHRIPVSRGGTNAESNLLTACLPCNIGKSDRLLARDIQ